MFPSSEKVPIPKEGLSRAMGFEDYRHPLIASTCRAKIVWIGLIILMNLAFFGEVLFTDKTFFVRDVTFFHYPLKRLVTEAYSSGQWPSWNPYIQLGQPLLANPNAMAFYPTQIFFHLLPFQTAFELHYVLHCVFSGIAVFLLGLTLGLHPHAAFFSAMLFNFSGATLSLVNLANILPIVTYLPLLTWVLLKNLQRFSLIRIAGASLLFGFFFLLLEPVSILAVALFLIPTAIGFYGLNLGPKVPLRQAIGISVIIGASGFFLAAVQFAPTWELIQNSGRKWGLEFESIAFWSLHPMNLMQVVAPRIFGDLFKLAHPDTWGSIFFDNREPYLFSCYFGLFPLMVAFLGMSFARDRRMQVLLLGTAVLAMVLAFGRYTPIYPWLFENLFFFRFGRFPAKYFLVTVLSLALLAGFGLEWIEKVKGKWRSGSTSICLAGYFFSGAALLIFGLSFFFSFPQIWRTLNLGEWEPGYLTFSAAGEGHRVSWGLVLNGLKHLQVTALVFFLFLLVAGLRRVRPTVVRSMVIGFVFYDLFLGNYWINPLTSNEILEKPAPAVSFLKRQMENEGLFRSYSMPINQDKQPVYTGSSDSIAWDTVFRKQTLFEFLAAQDHIQFAVFNPVDRLETMYSQLLYFELNRSQTIEQRIRFLAGLNVKFLLSIEEIASPLLDRVTQFKINSEYPLIIYRLKKSLPRAFLVDPYQSRLEKFSFKEVLSLHYPEDNILGAGALPPTLVTLEDCSVRITQYLPDQVDLEVATPSNRVLVLLDSYYPGWSATVDGQEIEVRSINYVYRGLDIPKGRHEVVFRYHPRSLYVGLTISLLTVTGWILALALFPSKKGSTG